MGEPLWELEIGRKRRGDSHLLRSFYAATNSEKLSDASIHHFQRDKVLGRVCKLEPAGYTRRYETKRTYKHAMEAAPTAASASKTSNGTTCFGPSTHHQRHLVDSTYRCPMAGCAQALWLLEHRGQPLLSLAKSRSLATSL